MKKIIFLIIASVLLISACSSVKNTVDGVKSEVTKNDNQPPEEKEYKDKVIAAIIKMLML